MEYFWLLIISFRVLSYFHSTLSRRLTNIFFSFSFSFFGGILNEQLDHNLKKKNIKKKICVTHNCYTKLYILYLWILHILSCLSYRKRKSVNNVQFKKQKQRQVLPRKVYNCFYTGPLLVWKEHIGYITRLDPNGHCIML